MRFTNGLIHSRYLANMLTKQTIEELRKVSLYTFLPIERLNRDENSLYRGTEVKLEALLTAAEWAIENGWKGER